MGTTTLRAVAALAAAPVLTYAQPASEPTDVRQAAREILSDRAPAIVTVKLLLRQRFIAEGREQHSSESSLELAGTVLTPEGLTVVSDAASNPAAMADSPPDANVRLESETGEVKLVLSDGREAPARFVLRDTDLDLAFLAPAVPLEGHPHVELVEDAAPGPLDDLILLFPLPKALNREIGVLITAVRGVVRKPREFLAIDVFDGVQSLGCPAFDAAGRAVGLVVLRRSPFPVRPSGGFRDMFELLNPVVLSAGDVSAVARQALAVVESPE